MHLLSITVNNPLRCGVTFSVRQKQHIARRYFFGISPAAGQIEKGKSITITIAVVLYQPIMARIVVPVYFESEDREYKEYIHFAIRVSCSKAALLREIDPVSSQNLTQLLASVLTTVFFSLHFGSLVAAKLILRSDLVVVRVPVYLQPVCTELMVSASWTCQSRACAYLSN